MEIPKTIRATDLIKIIETNIKEFGNLPIFISDNHGELALTKGAIRFSNRLGYKNDPKDTEMKTFTGQFFILSNLRNANTEL